MKRVSEGKKARRDFGRPIIGLCAAALLLALARLILNPERQALDDRARWTAPGRFAALSDGFTHYQLTGPAEGPPIVLIHGFSVPSFIWDGTFEALGEAGFRVLRYDLYGRGFSDRPKTAYGMALYIRQLSGLLDAAGVQGKVGLVGLSMGGGIAAAFAAAYPGRISRIVLMDPAPSSAPPLTARILGLPLLGDYLVGTLGRFILPAGQSSDFFDPSAMPAGYLERYRVQMRYRGFSRAIASSVRHIFDAGYMERYAALEKTGLPILLVWGRQDRTAPFADSQRLLGLMPGAVFLPVDRAAHLPHIERPDEVIPALVDFFKP